MYAFITYKCVKQSYTQHIFLNGVRYSWLPPYSPARDGVIFLGSPWRKKAFSAFPATAWRLPVIVWCSLSQPAGFSVAAWGSPWGPESPPTPSRAALMSLPSLAGLWGPGESQREVSLGRLLGEPDLPGAGLHELHSLPALHRGQREMSPPAPFVTDWPSAYT